jgi:Holliday junction DNA helicase RuvA
LQVREDALVLFGFETKKEYDMYSLLLSVSGVGPKTAFSVISVVSVDDLLEAIKDNNIDYFKKVPGLGTKTAMKIILELSQKLKEEFKMEKMYLSDDDKTVVDALVSLGFKSQEAKTILQKIPKNLSVEERIREGIKLATSKKESSSVKR